MTWPAPPIYLMKQMDTMLFQHSQTMDEMKNRLNCIESGALYEPGVSGAPSELNLEQIKPALMADNEFVCGIVDNIMTNSNLSDIIEQIDAVQSENQELRELFYAQQKTINEMNIMLLKLFSQSVVVAAVPTPVTAAVAVPTPVTSAVAVTTPVTAAVAAAVAVAEAVAEAEESVEAAVEAAVEVVEAEEAEEEENVCQEVVEADVCQEVVEADADA